MKQDIHLAVVQYLDFNPIIVRFKHERLFSMTKLQLDFNPIIVRFKPSQRLLFSFLPFRHRETGQPLIEYIV